MVFPCPGPRAWIAPNARARSSEPIRMRGVRRHRIRPANEPPPATGAPETVGPCDDGRAVPVAGPGRKENVAEVTSRGLERRSCGYAKSSPLTLADGAEDSATDRPACERTVISFHPMRSA